ncbi:MAG: hypothetical protein ACKO9T_02980, partial [Nitrospira sp.]
APGEEGTRAAADTIARTLAEAGINLNLAPVVDLADRIVDLVSTGRTLKAHGLEEVEVIAESTARLIVNRASLKMKHEEIAELMARLRRRRARPQQSPRVNKKRGMR